MSYAQYVPLDNVKRRTRTEELRSMLPKASWVAAVVTQMGPKNKISKNHGDLWHDTKFRGRCGILWNLRLLWRLLKFYSTEELRRMLPKASRVAVVVMQTGPKTKISKNHGDLWQDTKFRGRCGISSNLRLLRSPLKIYSLTYSVSQKK